jgi:tetratricopeptide (TPR) repeat protein
MRDNLDAEDILPMLARLARAAAPESDAWIYAHRHLAELGVEHDPWRAALFARRVIAHRPDDDGAWAVLGLAQSLLGNCRYAARAYEHALALAPDNPWYAHNLGHLYDVALDRASDALPLLARATFAQPGEADIAASYAHALARCGKLAMAKRVLRRAIRHGGTADQMALARWLDTFDAPVTTGVTTGDAPKPAVTMGGEAPLASQALREASLAPQALREAPLASQALREAPLAMPPAVSIGDAPKPAVTMGDAPKPPPEPGPAPMTSKPAAQRRQRPVCPPTPSEACPLEAKPAALTPEPTAAARVCDEEPKVPARKKARRRRARERRTAGD